MNSLCYVNKRRPSNALQDNIERVLAEILPEAHERVIENWTRRIHAMEQSRGDHLNDINLLPNGTPIKCVQNTSSCYGGVCLSTRLLAGVMPSIMKALAEGSPRALSEIDRCNSHFETTVNTDGDRAGSDILPVSP